MIVTAGVSDFALISPNQQVQRHITTIRIHAVDSIGIEHLALSQKQDMIQENLCKCPKSIIHILASKSPAAPRGTCSPGWLENLSQITAAGSTPSPALSKSLITEAAKFGKVSLKTCTMICNQSMDWVHRRTNALQRWTTTETRKYVLNILIAQYMYVGLFHKSRPKPLHVNVWKPLNNHSFVKTMFIIQCRCFSGGKTIENPLQQCCLLSAY